jgi:uncharacterized membrane protein YidH (DUF202 family)
VNEQDPARPAGRPDRELDPTLATERTLLAWNRSALAVALIGALAIRVGAVQGSTAAYVLGGVLLTLAAVTWAYGHAAYRESRRRMAGGQPQSRPQVIRAVAAATAVTGVAAFVLALLS